MGQWQRDAFYQHREADTLPRYHVPRFIDTWKDGLWNGEDVWIIGGGPSASKIDYTLIEDRKKITVNMGFTLCEPSIAYIGSVLLLMHLAGKGELSSVPNKAALEAMTWNMQHPYGCHTIEVADERTEWGNIRDGLPVYSNSGLVAVNLADALGARRIFLVGFDMTGGKDGKTLNFHNEYPEHLRPSAGHYDTYLDDFNRVAKHCRAEVWNCSPNSRLTIFEHMPFEETLR